MKKVNAWDIVVDALLQVKAAAKPDVSLVDLDKLAESIIVGYGAIPINKGYEPEEKWQAEVRPQTPFPNTLVCNVNSVIAHGNATEYKLRAGDSVIFDLGVKFNNVCGDAALTVGIGELDNKTDRLLRYARLATTKGIEVIRPGVPLSTVGRVVEQYVALRGYVVNQTFAGHGIGAKMHEEPVIPHFYVSDFDEVFFEEGKMYCIEPIITYKDMWGMRAFNDWAWITRDGKRCAMFEHQILVTKTGCKILTKDLF